MCMVSGAYDAYDAYNVCGGLECLWCLKPMVHIMSVVV